MEYVTNNSNNLCTTVINAPSLLLTSQFVALFIKCRIADVQHEIISTEEHFVLCTGNLNNK